MLTINDKIFRQFTEGKLVIKVAKNIVLEAVNDFKYIGAYIANYHVDFKQRRGLSWSQF